jgi:anti-anti-sigma factor
MIQIASRKTRDAQVTARKVRDVLVVSVEGPLTRATAARFLRRARALVADLRGALVALDLAGVPTLDASGCAALIAFLRSLQPRRGDMCLFGVTPENRLFLELMQLHLLFDIAPDLDGAVECLQAAPVPLPAAVGGPPPAPAGAGRLRSVSRMLERHAAP